MHPTQLHQLKNDYLEFSNSPLAKERDRQFQLVPIFREIIWETLKNKPLKNEHLTGLIQMLGGECKPDNFKKYLEKNITDKVLINKLLKSFVSIGATGFTGIGLSSVSMPNKEQLEQIHEFLLNAFSVETVDQAVKLTEEFDKLKIPQVTKGIYSPWLYYIKPGIFPIFNNGNMAFRKWVGMPENYSQYIIAANDLKSAVNETDHGRIDWFAYNFKSNGNVINLNGNRLFKISHGSFFSKPSFKKVGLADIITQSNWISMGDETGHNQFVRFSEQERIGDYVYICHGGQKVYAIGRIISEVKSLNEAFNGEFPIDEKWSYREIEILYHASDKSVGNINDKRPFMPGGNSTFWEVPPADVEEINEKLFSPKFGVKFITDHHHSNPKRYMEPLNQILYGPPGTGKTYHTINKTLEILGLNNQNLSRQELRKLFDDKCREEQVVFTTFHQSLSYEDFIEGIKPTEPEKEGDSISYEIKPGVFMKLCIDAAFSYTQIKKSKETEEVLDFSLAFAAFTDELEEELAKGKPVPFATKSGGEVLLESISSKGNLIIMHHDGTRNYIVSKNRLSKLHKEIDNLDEVSNINDRFREIIGGSNASAYWAVLNHFSKNFKHRAATKESRSFTFDEKREAVRSMKNEDFRSDKAVPYVLIIDEINRGNVSQIFGELITLIESDKRRGMPEALEIVLPYSKEKFSVPPNLYIIGTMNTADRSVEALDTALRRRFSFVEMMPRYDVLKDSEGNDLMVEGVSLRLLLETINERLSYLLDEDHQVGHSFFLPVKSPDDLRKVFKNNILPQLKEFFFNDYSKIRLILGDGFVEKIEGSRARPTFATELTDDFILDKNLYKIKCIKDDFDIIEAISLMKLRNIPAAV